MVGDRAEEMGMHVGSPRTRTLAVDNLPRTVTGMVSCGLGLSVLFGWHAHRIAMVQVHPALVPMQYNTALGFVLCGVSLLSQLGSLQRLSFLCGALVSILGMATLAEYVTAGAFGIDELLMEHYIVAKTSHPGRMAPNTALAFSAVGPALMAMSGRGRQRQLVAGVLGAVTLSLGAVALSGYVLGLEAAYGWSELTRMALHTAAGLVVLGAGLVWVAWRDAMRAAGRAPEWAPVLVTLTGIVATVLVWEALFQNVQAHEQTILDLLRSQEGQEGTRDPKYAAEAPIREIAPWVALLGGLAFSGLLGLLVSSGQRRRLEADQLAQEVAERRLLEARLRASQERLQEVAEKVPDALWVEDIGSEEILYISPGYERLWGKTRESLYSDSTDWRTSIHPEDVPAVVAAHRRLLNGEPFDQEFRILRPDGGTSWVHARGTVVFDEGGRPLRSVGIAEDIGERKEIEFRLVEARRAAEAGSRAKSSFLAQMSHEIRTPMSAILGFADILQEQDLPPEERAEAVETIRTNGQHLLDVINDILDVSKIEAGKLAVDITDVSPFEVVDYVYRLMGEKAAEKALTLHVEYQGDFPEKIRSDATRLRQILINLVGNAIKFTERGSITLRVRHRRSQERMEFVVEDTGVGMSADQVSRVFNPFAQADSSITRRFGGTGLGLTISRQLATLLGGEIALESEPGRGSVFTVEIAASSPTDARRIHYEEYLKNKKQTAHTSHTTDLPRLECRILVADDARANRLLLERVLSRAGATVLTVENGQAAVREALDAAADEPFDVILMDMQMPVLDGHAATRQLRQLNYKRPIVALTASALETDLARCVKSGCDEALSKPINARSLINTVLHYVRKASKGPADLESRASELSRNPRRAPPHDAALARPRPGEPR